MTTTLNGRLVHNHTANSYLCINPEDDASSALYTKQQHHQSSNNNSNNILEATAPGIRYSLSEGKKGMPLSMQKASLSSVALAMRRSSNNSGGETKTDESSTGISSPSKNNDGTADNDNNNSSNSNSEEMTKVFVLLLEPKTKTFELIQLVYPTLSTTIGDILRMIPQHATELALGSQKYTGLCRPKDDHDLSDLDLLASLPTTSNGGGAAAAAADSNNNKNNKMECANVCAGEILVAIPKDYKVPEVTKFSHAILTNRRFTKLLRRSNPLAPKLRKQSDRNNRKDRGKQKSRKHRSRDRVHILEKHDESAEELLTAGAAAGGSPSAAGPAVVDQMQRALEKAASAAAQANANINININNSNGQTPIKSPRKVQQSPEQHGHQQQVSPGSLGRHFQMTSPSRNFQQHQHQNEQQSYSGSDMDSVASSLGTSRGSYAGSYASSSWVDGGASVYSASTAGADSIGESISSWSKSCGASFTKGQQHRTLQARHRNHQHTMGVGSMSGNGNGGNAMAQQHQQSHRRRNNAQATYRKFLLVATGTVVVAAYLTGCYLLDPSGQVTERVQTVKDNPMGLPGLVQVVLLVLILKKIQFLANRQHRKRIGSMPARTWECCSKSACPAVRMYAMIFGGSSSSSSKDEGQYE